MANRIGFTLVSGSPVDHSSMSSPADWWAWIWSHIAPYMPPVWVWQIAIALAAVIPAWRILRRGGRALIARAKANSFEDNLTIVAATIATGVSATGMWKFAGDVLHLWWPLRIVLFAFIEIAIITSAVRAKRSMRENFKAGVDGIAVWALACLTAALSSLDAASFGEAVFRLAAPLVTAWLWERGMRLERHRLRGTTGINWRVTPERVFVRLGLAEASDRTASEVDAHRRITRVALAAKKVHQLQEANATDRKVRSAIAKRDRALDKAVEHTGLARSEQMQWALLDMVTTLGGADELSALLGGAKAPWSMLDHPAVTGAAKNREAVQLAEAMREWTDAIQQQRDPEVSAAITSMAAYIAGRDAAEATGLVAPAVASPASGATETRPILRPSTVDSEVHRTVVDLVADPVANDDDLRDYDRDRDGDSDGDRERPDEQDNRDAEEWIRRQCRGRNGVGRRPTKTEVAKRYEFSETWGLARVRKVQERMTSQGYQFEADGTVIAPTRSVAEPTRERTSA